MKTGTIAGAALVAISLCSSVHADFKYTQQSKMTGGSLMKMTKTLGVFSKSMRQANEPQASTIMVKGNRMRTEHANGEIEIIDLDHRRFVYIDPVKKAYSSVTFDEFKAAMQRAQQRAQEERAKQAKQNPDAQDVKVTPKFDATVTGESREILGMKANEMKLKMEMQIESTDPKAAEQARSGSFVFDSDAWMAPSVPGYDEVRAFHEKLAKELDWYPGTMSGMFGMQNPQMGPAMAEFRKNAAKVKGMPMLQVVSIAGAANQAGPESGEPSRAAQPQSEPADDNSVPTSASQAVMKGLGGMFSHKKKKDQQQEQASSQGTNASSSRSAALMEMTTEVTSVSNSALDGALFDVPAGYVQVQRDPEEAMGGKR